MIRTHEPRGYAWTCPSLFQQTPEFRNISYDECQVDWQTDDFALSERAIKRQRIEKLANDFLNGHALNIPSARLPPQGIQHAVARSFARPKDARRAMTGIETTTLAAEAFWEDVHDQWEVLQNYNHVDDDEGHLEAAESDDEEVVVEVHAQASCTSRRRQRTIKIDMGPSDEALQQAAALRTRVLLRRSGRLSVPSMQRAQSEATIEETQEASSISSLQTSTSDIGPTPTAAWTSSKWLKTGMLELRHKAVDEECSKDELGLSSLPTPSQRAAARPMVSLRRERSALSQKSSGPPGGAGKLAGSMPSSLENDERNSGRGDEQPEQSEETAFVSIPTPGNYEQEDEESQDSQAQLLRRQGIRAAPRKSWASFGKTVEKPATQMEPSTTAPIHAQALSPGGMRTAMQDSASLNVGKVPKGKRATKSTGAAQPVATTSSARRSSRRKSAPSESQSAVTDMAELPVEQQRRMGSFRAGENTYMSVPGKDSSPFMFRKRISKFNNSDDPDIETLVVETKQRQPQTRTPKTVGFASNSLQLARINPVVDPTTPLVNEYLNRLLPNAGDSGSDSSSVRKALRDEMRLAGAEFSHIGGEPSYVQAEPVASEEQQEPSSGENVDVSEVAIERAPEMPPPQLWPGTQVLLAEAQKDLFTSPNKENTTLYLGDKTTPQTTRDLPRRRPLQTLSQEPLPMPSTQALLDGWKGWSSIKKPRSATGKRSSIEQSPSVNKGSGENLIGSDPGISHSFDESRLRKSSLRYSISYNDSPGQQETESLPVAAFFPAWQSAHRKRTSTTSLESSSASGAVCTAQVSDQAQEKSIRPSGAVASSATFSQGHFLSTTGSTTVSSLSLQAGLSPTRLPATVQQQHEKSSLSFSPIVRSESRAADPKPAASTTSRIGLSTHGSWSFSPLLGTSNAKQVKDTPTDYGTPAASLPPYQQAHDSASDDVSGHFLQTVDMDSQELDFTVTDLVGDILGSAQRDMPHGTGVFSQ